MNHLFHKCSLTETQAKGVANALKLAYPHYKPRITSDSRSEISYPSLLKEWYANRKNTDIKLKSVPGKLEREFDESRLLELFEEQISRELSGFTPILSIEVSKKEDTENNRLKEMFLECRSKWKEALIKSFEKDMFKTKNAQGKCNILYSLLCNIIILYLSCQLHPNKKLLCRKPTLKIT